MAAPASTCCDDAFCWRHDPRKERENLLSGTSWAGGSMVRRFRGVHDDELGSLAEVASPIYDVQVPVNGVLRQPDDEVSAVAQSVFRLVPMMS